MANYKETLLTGAVWTRSHEVRIQNPYVGDKIITFYEEQVKETSDGVVETKPSSQIHQPFNQPETAFDLLHPVTGAVVGEATYQDVYVMLHSLYMHLAALRDAE